MLVVISPGFPANEADSTCLPAIQQIVLALKDKLGAQNLCILTMHYPFEASSYQWQGITVYALAGENKKGVRRLLTWLAAWRKLMALKKQHTSLTLLSLWLTDTSLVTKYFAKVYGIPCAFWVQGQDVKPDNKYIPLIRPNASQIISISNFSALQLAKNFNLHPTVIANNGIRPASMPELTTNARTIDILGVGSLTSLKNYKLFIEVLAELVIQFPNLKCVHAGEGPQANELQNYAHKLGLKEYVHFLGNTEHNKVIDLMNTSKVFLHTSQFEGSSTVIAEALYMGCAVVSTVSISENQIAGLKLGGTKTELLNFAADLLHSYNAPRRILVHNLKDSIAVVCEKLNLQ